MSSFAAIAVMSVSLILVVAACGSTGKTKTTTTAGAPSGIDGTITLYGQAGSNQKVDGATISVKNGNATVTTVKSQSGSFHVNVAVGTYTLSAMAGNTPCSASGPVVVVQGQRVRATLSCNGS